MAREECDREDLLNDAIAFHERVDLAYRCPERAESQRVFVGFRKNGGVSFYFDADPVYHMNSRRALRRAFVNGVLLKAEQHRLVGMRRARLGGEVRLLSAALTSDEHCQFEQEFLARLAALRQALDGGAFELIGQIPTSEDIVARVVDWLVSDEVLAIAKSPHAT